MDRAEQPIASTEHDRGRSICELATLRIGALLNTSSGSCDAQSEPQLKAILDEAKLTPVALRCVPGAELDGALAALIAAPVDVMIVLGGDGTIRTAAEKCGAAGITLIPLPGGTMNMLPRALYGARSWQVALAQTLAQPHVTKVGGGHVEGHQFFCAGIFGAASLWAEAREAIRENRLWQGLRRAVAAYRRTFSRKVRYRFGPGRSGTSTAVAVICPLISLALPSDEPALEAVALELHDAREAFRLALNAVFADWRADPGVSTSATPLVQITSRRPIPAILDGEMVRLGPAAEIRFVPHCFSALVPENSPSLPAESTG
jgi:diacylglycerol kinase family enzyme